jgi:hypothetical protein
MYRSLMATRRMVVVLDNIADLPTLRSLLPGAGMSMVLVTSRDPLRGLQALRDSVAMRVEVLSHEPSADLIGQVLDRWRVTVSGEIIEQHRGREPR